jgi:hypothetical protein
MIAIIAIAVCVIAIVRFVHVERKRRRILREAWEDAKGPAAQDDDTTKTWPVIPGVK